LSKSAIESRTVELMEKFRLTDMGNRYPAQISGGQQQRVALARALAAEPDILLLDEPFSALDEHLKNQMIKEMQESLKEFQGNTLYVTHNMEEAYRLCSRIAVLSAGSVEAFDLKQELFQKPTSLETAKITGCKNIAKAVRVSAHNIDIPDWGIQVRTDMAIESAEGFAGIRANHIKLMSDSASDSTTANCFPVWIADESETPFRTTLYLKIGSSPQNTDDFHLLWEINQEQVREIKSMPQSFKIQLDPAHVFFVER
jgi:ABC-type sulfate/molybdate transport systems ATPase subunit